jgi:hypothetical protein
VDVYTKILLADAVKAHQMLERLGEGEGLLQQINVALKKWDLRASSAVSAPRAAGLGQPQVCILHIYIYIYIYIIYNTHTHTHTHTHIDRSGAAACLPRSLPAILFHSCRLRWSMPRNTSPPWAVDWCASPRVLATTSQKSSL